MDYGVKAQNLIQLRDIYPNNVPLFEVLPFQELIDSYPITIRNVNKLVSNSLQNTKSVRDLKKDIHSVAESIKLNQSALLRHHKKILAHGWTKVSIRTSALAEDGQQQSFAGQYVSFVDIAYDKQKLEEYVLACFTSLFSLRVISYARSHHLQDFRVGGSAIVQQMFYGQKSGVLFTEDGQGIMTFAVADSWRNTAVDDHDSTVIRVPRMSPEAAGIARRLQHIAKIGIELDLRLGQPLDIEWAYNKQTFMLLQMRPLTTSTTAYSLTWDATNISENYPSITLPLTYSFIKNVYSQVYPSFFRLMGMGKKKLEARSWIFDNALGYIGGRVYYRIENWYELVKLIPGSRNQEFFEAMLNPAKKRVASDTSPTLKNTLLNPSFWVLALRFGWLLLRSDALSRKFAKNFATKLEQYQRLDWPSMTAEASLGHLRDIRQELLVMWGVPILNDVRVMIFHGIFKTILLKDADNATYLTHLKGLSDQASIKPLEALYALGKTVDVAMRQEKITNLTDLQTTKAWSRVETAVKAFIVAFGGRTPDELQLENPRLGENIWDVLHLAYASKDARLSVSKPGTSSAFGSFPLFKRLLARIVITNVRRAIDYRERFRFNRAQVFGLARTAYLAVGNKMAEAQVIANPDDVFWLTEQEIETVIQGHSWSYDLQPTIALRQEEYDTYSKQPFWLRVSGRGVVAPMHVKNAMPKNGTAHGIAGLGVSPGKVTAPVIVVDSFDPELDVTNKILVVKHVDPGWTLLLVQAAGVITEQGNPLSHVAIVSREISIPAIVGVKDAVKHFSTGAVVTIDGTTGEILYGS